MKAINFIKDRTCNVALQTKRESGFVFALSLMLLRLFRSFVSVFIARPSVCLRTTCLRSLQLLHCNLKWSDFKMQWSNCNLKWSDFKMQWSDCNLKWSDFKMQWSNYKQKGSHYKLAERFQNVRIPHIRLPPFARSPPVLRRYTIVYRPVFSNK
jgi:hypothetical protein